jgi:uncharacterized protein YndB with AHSA1/START domain
MGTRLQIRNEVTIAKPAEEVFAYLADVTRHGEWSPKAYRAEDVSGPVAQGTTFTSYGWVPGDKEHRNDVEVTAYDPPRAIAFTSREKDEQFISTFTLTPEAAGTKVTRVMDMPRPGGAFGMVFPLVANGFIKPAVGKGMGMLKKRLESAT